MPDKAASVAGPAHILIVTGDADTRSYFKSLFVDERFRFSETSDLLAMHTMLRTSHFDLLIIDGKLGGSDCLAACRSVRSISEVAIVLIVEGHHDWFAVAGLDAGADAYVVRADRPADTLIRLRCVLRRTMEACVVEDDARAMRFAGWRLNAGDRVLLDPSGVAISLTAAEFDLLVALARNAGSVLSRAKLLASTRFGVARPVERSVDVHIARLRRKIELDPKRPVFIKTVRLGGYVFAVTASFEH